MPRRVNKSLVVAAVALVGAVITLYVWWRPGGDREPYRFSSTVAGLKGEFGEPFGLAAKGSDIFVSDGANGKIWLVRGDIVSVFAEGLDTPSGITFDEAENLLVADSGTHTIRILDKNGRVSTVAGVEGRSGFADGDAASALFNAPIGIAAGTDGKIFVADTYNDRIRMIENGRVSTLAGTTFGYADGVGAQAKFDTPCGIAIWHDKIVVTDAGNRRIRVVEPDGRVWTLVGNGDADLKDGLLLSSSFVEPTAIAVDGNGSLIITDGNAIRQIGGHLIPVVRTISNEARGVQDGALLSARFNRPSGITVTSSGDLLVADSDNHLIRRISPIRSGHEITKGDLEALRDKPEDFRKLQAARWPYDPPERPRDIAGTMGELRGKVPEINDVARFHNGLDIAGGYGEIARSIRDEKVLQPVAASNFNTLRELIRMPSLGYVHLRLGRDSSSKPFGDLRFQFQTDYSTGKLSGVRVPRGTKFHAGEPIGTLNAMNHVHLIAGRSGFEMNALDALILPGIKDTKPPVIERVGFVTNDGVELTKNDLGRVEVTGKTHIVMRAYDQMDGSAARRRLGIYRAGIQLLRADGSPLGEIQWTLTFARMPPNVAARLVYTEGSQSGATGETIFNYLVTNHVDGDLFSEGHLDAGLLESGMYIQRVIAADYFGNQSYVDTPIEVRKP
jgi:hypothetical protein